MPRCICFSAIWLWPEVSYGVLLQWRAQFTSTKWIQLTCLCHAQSELNRAMAMALLPLLSPVASCSYLLLSHEVSFWRFCCCVRVSDRANKRALENFGHSHNLNSRVFLGNWIDWLFIDRECSLTCLLRSMWAAFGEDRGLVRDWRAGGGGIKIRSLYFLFILFSGVVVGGAVLARFGYGCEIWRRIEDAECLVRKIKKRTKEI